jgi:hypothetical protein
MRPGERTDASCDVWRLAAVAARTAESDRADLWKVGWIYMGKYMQNIGQYMYIYTLLLLYIYTYFLNNMGKYIEKHIGTSMKR